MRRTTAANVPDLSTFNPLQTRAVRRDSDMISDISMIDKFLEDKKNADPLADFVIDEDTFSKNSEPENDPVVKFKEVSRIFYVGEIRHEYHQDDSIFMLASAC